MPKLFTLRADTMSKTHQWVCGGILLGIGVFLLILIGAAMPNLVDKFDGRPVGLDTLAAALGEEAGTIEDVYEP